MYDNGREKHFKEITDTPDLVFYGKDGRAIKALDPNWAQYIDIYDEEDSDY